MQKQHCSVEGCIAPAHSKGLCGKHYARQRNHGKTDVVLPRGRKPLGEFESLKDIWRYDPQTGFFHSKIDTWGMRGPVSIGDVVGIERKRGYIQLSHRSKKYLAQRVAWFFMTGEWPPHHYKMQVEHRNSDKMDNRWINLFLVPPAKNSQNLRDSRYKNNVSGYRGVSLRPDGKWHARIQVNRRIILLGYYTDLATAIKVRKYAERICFSADRHP